MMQCAAVLTLVRQRCVCASTRCPTFSLRSFGLVSEAVPESANTLHRGLEAAAASVETDLKQPQAKKPRLNNALSEEEAAGQEPGAVDEQAPVVSPVRESSRLKSKQTSASKSRPEPEDSQRQQQQPDQAHMESVMQAAAAAQRVKHAYTIDEGELLALRPTLLKGFAFMQRQRRDDLLEADLKTMLYYFRHHTVDPAIIKQLCFVEAVYVLQKHPNRLVADLAAQLLTLGPWKVVYEQLAAINTPWFEQHSVANQVTAQSGAVPGGAAAPVPAAIATHNKP